MKRVCSIAVAVMGEKRRKQLADNKRRKTIFLAAAVLIVAMITIFVFAASLIKAMFRSIFPPA